MSDSPEDIPEDHPLIRKKAIASEGSSRNQRKEGSKYEAACAVFLESIGFRILERNFRSRFGEIDLIGRENEYLVFVEVKYRRDGRSGDPAEAVDARKQQKIRMTAQYYLTRNGISPDVPIRFDVAAILGNRIHLIRDAFSF
ncbi:putative endonuclease [[Clostridium] aminophilum]|uniref:UPF0102 protein SAMN04487771_101828 n=1 Tax=[Clostridium] aminophilum TaxID=1526 RepID=A0A1I0EGT0_9FIRM|nr:YraN family protein [[Clostridium] aminophilum]SET43804.1 putative endonuclease [[Clostridium] aminophilum]